MLRAIEWEGCLVNNQTNSTGTGIPDCVSEWKSFTVILPLEPAKTTPVYDAYWRFAAERQRIFFCRIAGQEGPWTADTVLQKHKFTNAYRASDRVSQYLIRNVIYNGDQSAEEVFFRTLIFKFFNRVATWESLVSQFGKLSSKSFDILHYDSALTSMLNTGQPIFSAAYMMPAGTGDLTGLRKHRSYLCLLDRMMKDEVPAKLIQMEKMRDAFMLLRQYPMIGDFLAYQYVTDLNYSAIVDFTEMEFVIPGPGAKSGLRKCFSSFGGLSEADLIQLVTERQELEFGKRGIEFLTLWGRPLQLVNCQNLFCEIDKYARVAFPGLLGSGIARGSNRYIVPHQSYFSAGIRRSGESMN